MILKIRVLLICLSLFGLSLLLSCGSNINSNEEESNSVDSINPEIFAISQQIADDQDNPTLYNQRSILYLKYNETLKALADINKAIEFDPDNSVYYRTLSDVYFSMGRVTNCRDALNKALEMNNEDTNAYLKLAELEFYFQNFNKTNEYLDKALSIDPINAKAYFIRGMVSKENTDTLLAIKAFQIAIEYDPEYYHAYMQLGLIFASRKNPLAADYFNNAIKVNPLSIEAYYALGMFYQNSELYNEAIETYYKILKYDPLYKYAHYNLGYIHLVYLQVYDVAAKHFTDAINSDNNFTEAWYNRGYCYELLGDMNRSKADYQQALKLKPGYSKAIDGLNRLDVLIKH